MRFHYDLTQAEEIYRDVPVYDAASMENGELVMLGTTADDSNADQGVSFITAYTGGAAEAVDALGTICEDFSTAADIDNTPVQDCKYLKCIVNPFAVYLAEYSQGTSDDVAVTTGSTGTTLTIGSLEDNWDAGWVYLIASSGSLRQNVACASGSLTMDSALTVTTSSRIIKIRPVNSRLTNLNTAATMLTSAAAVPDGISLHVVKNWMTHDGQILLPLRYANRGTDGLTNVKLYSDLAMLDHVYNNA